MKNTIQKILLFAAGCLAALAITAGLQVAIAGQVSSATYKTMGYKYADTHGYFQDSSDHWYQVSGDFARVAKESPTWTATFDDGDGEGLYTHSAAGLTTSTTLTNLAYFEDGLVLAYEPLATQTLDIDMDASSLDIGGDQTADDGYELFSGTMGATGRPFVVGVDEAFQTCVTFSVEDISGTDDLHFGFRNVDAARGGFDDYLDAAALGCTAADGTIDIETIDGNAATTTTDTTDTLADATSTTWCVLVSDTGVVTYTIDGVAPTTTAAFTLDTGAMMVPFFRFLQDTALTGEVDITSWETKYQ